MSLDPPIYRIYFLIKPNTPDFCLGIVIESEEENGTVEVKDCKLLSSYSQYQLVACDIYPSDLTKGEKFRVLARDSNACICEIDSKDFPPHPETIEKFFFKLNMHGEYKSSEVSGNDNYVHTIFIFAHLIVQADPEAKSFFNLIKNTSKLPQLADISKGGTLCIDADLLQELKKFPIILLALNGKLFSWTSLLKNHESKLLKVCAQVFSDFKLSDTEIINIVTSEKDNERYKLLLAGIQNKIIIDLKSSENVEMFQLFIERIKPPMFEFCINALEALQQGPKKKILQEQLVSWITAEEMSKEEKIRYLLLLYSPEKNLIESLVQINKDLKSSKSDKKIQGDSIPALEMINRKIGKVNFWAHLKEEKSSFYKFIQSKEIDSTLRSVILSSPIGNGLNDYVTDIFDKREKDAIDFLAIVFIELNGEYINQSCEDYIREFLKRETSWNLILKPNKEQMVHFLQKILIPHLMLIVTVNENAKNATELIDRWRDLAGLDMKATLQEIDTALEKYLEDFQTAFAKNLWKKFFEKESLTQSLKYVRRALKLETALKDQFFERLIATISQKQIEMQADLSQIVNTIIKRIQENSTNSKEWKAAIKKRLFEAADIFDKHKLRKAIFESPKDAKVFKRLMQSEEEKKDSEENITVLRNLKEIVNLITSSNIEYRECQQVKKYDQKDFIRVVTLLKFVDAETDFQETFAGLYKMCDDFKSKEVLTLRYFLNFYRDIEVIQASEKYLSAFEKITLPTMKVSELKLPENLRKFSKCASQCVQILGSPFFKHFLKIPDPMNSDDLLINACEEAYAEMINLFRRITTGLKSGDLSVDVLQTYFCKLELRNFKEELLKITMHTKLDLSDVRMLSEALYLYLEHEQLAFVADALYKLALVFPFDSDLLLKARSYKEAVSNLKDPEVANRTPIRVFLENARSFKELLQKNGIRDISETSPVNQLIVQLGMCRDLCGFLDQLSNDDFRELIDFVNDNDEGYIKRSTIDDFEKAWEFKENYITKAKTLVVLFENCEQALQEEKWKDITSIIKSCAAFKNSLDRTLMDMKNKEASFKFRIEGIYESSVITIKDKDTTKKATVSVNRIDSVSESMSKEVYELGKVHEFKEKALLVMNSPNTNKDQLSQVDMKKLRHFVNYIDALEEIMACYEDLRALGYTQNFIDNNEKEIYFTVSKGECDIEAYKVRVKKYKEEWKALLDELYSTSYKFSHFYGRQLRHLHHAILMKKGKLEDVRNLILWADMDFQAFKEEVDNNFTNGRIYEVIQQSPSEQISFLCDLLGRVDPLLGESLTSKPRVKLVSVGKENVFLGLISSVPKNEMLSTKLSQILFCRPGTQPQEVVCFLNRAFLNGQKLPYFLVGFEHLTAQLQNHFCEVLERLMIKLRPHKKNVNLVLIGSKTNEKLYSYFYHHKEFIKDLPKEVLDGKDYLDILSKMTEECSIICSAIAGLGKTHYILRKCQERNLKPCFFPIAGNITEERIAERLSSIKVDKDTGLILQIHNVVDKKILDQILFQLVFFRSLKNDGFLFFTEEKFHLFIELQNILVDEKERYLDSLQTLSFSKYTKSIKCIEEARPEDVSILDPQTEFKFHFVMKYLKALNENQLAKKHISYNDYVSEFYKNSAGSRVQKHECQALLKEYFFTPLEIYRPSYIQLMSFIEIFFTSLKTFADSPYLSIKSIEETYSKGSSSLREEMCRILRSNFVQILMKNSREFVIRTVLPKDFSSESKTSVMNLSEKLKDLPLLIMKLGESDDDFSYSFIYNEAAMVPKELKIFILTQGRPRNIAQVMKWIEKPVELNKDFTQEDLTLQNSEGLLQVIQKIAGVASIKADPNYVITLDNFYKMCLIIQRMRSNLPIVIMGETGVGKTALIRFLVENVYGDKLKVINIHAGVNENILSKQVGKIKKKAGELQGKRLWVFFDEFNTSEEVGLISEILLNRRFLGEEIGGNLIFLGACNPSRKKEEKKELEQVGLKKKSKTSDENKLLYKVLPPPESLIEVMWDYQDLKEKETLKYIQSILKMNYKAENVINVISFTHKYIQNEIEKSSVSLRDVARFKMLYEWFLKNMPSKPPELPPKDGITLSDFNYTIPKDERAFILTLSFCYYLRLPKKNMRETYIREVELKMGYEEGHILKVLTNEQMDYLSRMKLPQGTALNLALRENVFSALVCLINKIPIIIVGMPGCSKSLAVSLLCANLRGQNSPEPFFRQFKELSFVSFQGSESCTSEGVQKVFERARRNLNIDGVLPTILFDEIGLAEESVHNPLKVLHSYLEVGESDVSFIGISNWELDAAKMSRFLVVSRPLPEESELVDTAKKIMEGRLGKDRAEAFERLTTGLSASYSSFITNWKKSLPLHPDFFGLRDFYSLVKFTSTQLKKQEVDSKDHQKILEIVQKGVQRNFDGQANSIKKFLNEVTNKLWSVDYPGEGENNGKVDTMSLLQDNLNDKDSRALLLIIRGEALIHMASNSIKVKGEKIITVCGSTFQQDMVSEEYNIRVLSDFINYVQQGYVIFCKDLNNSIQTSLYDLYNTYDEIGDKKYCRVALGANLNPKCLVHPNFKSVVYINEVNLSDVDAPFLNRFEKHYLTLDRFFTPTGLSVLKKIEEWIQRITAQYSKDNNAPLKQESFIVNSSREVVASLCLKTFRELNVKTKTNEEFIEEQVKQAKRELLQKATSDFMLWIEHSDLRIEDKEEYDFIRECYQAKFQNNLEDLLATSSLRLIVFTFDQMSNSFSFPDSITVRVLRIVEMKCERDLKFEIQSYFESTQDLCVIRMDYDTEIKHLSLLLFLIDNCQKLAKNKDSNKNFIIVLYYSRVAAIRSDDSTLKEISHLNGWNQVFYEKLSSFNKVEELPPTIYGFIEDGTVCLEDAIVKAFQNSMKRFNFKFPINLEEGYSSGFTEFLLSITNDEAFILLAKPYLCQLISQNKFPDWRTEILYHKEIANLALNLYEAIELYVVEQVEDLLTLFLKQLFEEDVFTSIFTTSALRLLEASIPGITSYLKKSNEESKEYILESNLEFLQKTFKHCLSREIEKLPRVTSSIPINLNYPRLFPFSKRDESCLFMEKAGKSSLMSLSSIVLKLKELELRFMQSGGSQEDEDVEEEEADEEAEEFKDIEEEKKEYLKDLKSQHNSMITQFDQTFCETTVLATLYPERDGQDAMKQFNEVHVEKEFYLTDMRNSFIEKVAKTDLRTSIFLDRLIKDFLDSNYSVEEYLLVLLRGGALWKQLLQIYQQLQWNKDFVENLLFLKYEKRGGKKVGDFLKSQISYVRMFFNNCEELLVPTEINMKALGGSKKYFGILTNIYVWLVNIRKEFGVDIPYKLTIWKNFVDLIRFPEIYEELHEKLDESADAEDSIFVVIDDFLEKYKKNKPQETKANIASFQAAVLFINWVKILSDFEDDEDDRVLTLTRRLVERINQDEYFSHYCSTVLSCIFFFIDNYRIDALVDSLSTENLNFICRELDRSLELELETNPPSNLSFIITDYFDKTIVEAQIVKLVDNEVEASVKYLEFDLANFRRYYEMILSQQANFLQILAIIAFFKHYLRFYKNCILGDRKDPVLNKIDSILQERTPLAKSLCVFTLKLLRQNHESFEDLYRFLFSVRNMDWPENFRQEFDNVEEKAFFIPAVSSSLVQNKLEEKWKRLSSLAFNNEALFQEIFALARDDYLMQYQLLNLFLIQAYAGEISDPEVNNLKTLFEKKKDFLLQVLNKYQYNLMVCYLNRRIDDIYLYVDSNTSSKDLNIQIPILNIVNWLVSLKDFDSPWTSLFFQKGEIPDNFANHFNEQFVIGSEENPFVRNALKVYERCRHNLVYKCSSECDYIYTVPESGWMKITTRKCPFCGEEIEIPKGDHEERLKRAQRLGPGLVSESHCVVQKSEGYWKALEEDIMREINRMREKKSIKVFKRDELVEKRMTGYSSYIEEENEKQTSIVKKITKSFLRFILHSSLYVCAALDWIKPEEVLQVNSEGFDAILGSLKNRVFEEIYNLRNELECNDWVVWVLALEQTLESLVKSSAIDGSKISYKERADFEGGVEEAIYKRLGTQKKAVIKENKKMNRGSLNKFDLVLCEEEVHQDYRFLQILRLNKYPSLEDMLMFHEHTIKTKYPLLDECVNNLSEIQEVAKLFDIIQFSNEIKMLVEYQLTRKEAEKTDFAEIINTSNLSEEKQRELKKLLNNFLESWNSLKDLPRYNMGEPVIAFLVDLDETNKYGNTLARVISTLSEKQNTILNRIDSRTKNLSRLENVNLFDNSMYLPQMVSSEDILNITTEKIQMLIAKTSSCYPQYENGSLQIYDFERIQFNLLIEMVGKKMLIVDQNLYQNVKFRGEVFSRQKKFSDYITEIRKLGLNNPIPNQRELDEKFNRIRGDRLYSTLKHILGSLEKIMTFYKNLRGKNIKISDYVKKYNFTSISNYITAEAPIKDYDISCLVPLYEWAEKRVMPTVWDMLSKSGQFKSPFTTSEKKKIIACLQKIRKMSSIEAEDRTLPDLAELTTAIERFVLRCLLLGDLNPKEYLKNYLFIREDFWTSSYNTKKAQNLEQELSDITLNKIFSLHELIVENPRPAHVNPSPNPSGIKNFQIFI